MGWFNRTKSGVYTLDTDRFQLRHEEAETEREEAIGGVIEADDDPLTLIERVGRPKVREWNVANRLFGHVSRCRCSTCSLSATLAAMIRRDEDLNGPRPRLEEGPSPRQTRGPARQR